MERKEEAGRGGKGEREREEEKGKGVGREGNLSLGQAPPTRVPPAEEAEVRGESVKGLHLFPGLSVPSWPGDMGEAGSPLWPSSDIKQWGIYFTFYL